LYMMGMQFGEEMAVEAANIAEYLWNKDPSFDPFAALYSESAV
jgi:hypothetical protein